MLIDSNIRHKNTLRILIGTRKIEPNQGDWRQSDFKQQPVPVIFVVMISISFVIGQKAKSSTRDMGSILLEGTNYKAAVIRNSIEPVGPTSDTEETQEKPKMAFESTDSSGQLYDDATNLDPRQEDLFDAEEDDEEEEEFYSQNPLDQRTELNMSPEINVDDSEFREPDPHRSRYKLEPNTSSSHNRGSRRELTEQSPLGCALNLARGLCISLASVEWAIRRARRTLRFRSPEGLNSREPSESTINSVGELNELTTAILAAKLGLSSEEVAFEMEQIDVSRTSLWLNCPLIFRVNPVCRLLSRYRTHTGQCNNLYAAYLGSSNTPFVRNLPADYADGVGMPRRSSSSSELPPARLVALSLHPDVEILDEDHSVLFMSWGQLINHDLAMASGAREATGHSSACCSSEGDSRVCMPIRIAANDPVYGQHGIRCQDFKRSIAAIRPGCSLGPRAQLNLVTSFVDASFVYGSRRSESVRLRRNSGGLLEMLDYFEDQGLKELLPGQEENPDDECVGRPADRFCFLSGDTRTNQQIHLAALHTIHSRQHNHLAEALGRLNPHWSDNRLYHEARHIHIAMVQHILLSEYLPALLGASLCDKYNLTESPLDSYWDYYDPTLNPGISPAFAAAAFRQGHTRVPSQVFRFNNQHQATGVYRLRQLFRQPWALYEPGAMDEFVLGMVDAPAQSFDPFISIELSGHLLETPEEPVGLDLTAINIQRGRDQGLPGYNAFRLWCGLERVESFEELGVAVGTASAQAMASLYESVDDIDLFTGGISEFPLAHAQVGPTFACIIGRQFQSVRASDRFWFESSQGAHAFSLAQLASIKQVSLARLLCANSDSLVTIQQMALHLPHPVLNPRLPCAALPDLDLTLWFEPRPAMRP